MKDELYKLLDGYVEAYRLMAEKVEFTDENGGYENCVYLLGAKSAFQMWNLIRLCEILGIEYTRKDWDANERCGSNWDIVSFVYKDVTFFELVGKIKEKEEENS